MKFILSWIFVLMFSIPTVAQPTQLDSLLHLLKTNQAPYSALLQEIEPAFDALDSATAFHKARELTLISRTILSSEVPIYLNLLAAEVYARIHHTGPAERAARQAYQLAKAGQLPYLQARSLVKLGYFYKYQYRDGLALKAFLEAYELYRSLGQTEMVAEPLCEIGNVYYHSENYLKAREYLERAYQLGSHSLNSRTLISASNTIGMIYKHYNQNQPALQAFTRALDLARSRRDSAWIGIVSGNIGHVYESQGDYAKALPYYLADFSLSERFGEWESVAVVLADLGRVYTLLKDYPRAWQYLELARHFVETRNLYERRSGVYKTLAFYYSQTHQYQQAYQYQVLHAEVKDSLQKIRLEAQIDRIQASFDLDRRQAQIELLKRNNKLIQAEAQRQNIILASAIVMMVFIAVLVVLLYRNNRVKHRANQILTEQKQVLHEQNEEINRKNAEIVTLNGSLEKMVEERTHQLQVAMDNLLKQKQDLEQFSYTISHNMRSPISQIMGLISIFNQEDMNDAGNKQLLQSLAKSASNLNGVVRDLNDILNMRENGRVIRERIMLSEVVDSVSESLREEIDRISATVVTDFAQGEALFSIRSYIHSIVFNLLSNALKYYSYERKPVIRITTGHRDGYFCLEVQDNGIGIDFSGNDPQKIFRLYQRMHTHTEGRGLGLYLVKEQAEALGGKVEVESVFRQGCTFRVYLKESLHAVVDQTQSGEVLHQ